MGRYSPTVVADYGPSPWLVMAQAFEDYRNKRKRRADEEEEKAERDQDRAERQADRQERQRDREESRARQEAMDVLSGIRRGTAPGGMTPPTQPPGPAMPGTGGTPPIVPFNPDPSAAPRIGPRLEDVAPHDAPVQRPAPPLPKPAAPGSFTGADFAPVQPVQLTNDFYFDPTIPNQMASQRRRSELDDYVAKLQLKQQYDPDPPRAWQPGSMEEEVELDRRKKANSAMFERRTSSGSGGGSGGGEYSTDDARRDSAADKFADRYVQMFYGNVPRAVAYIESKPELKAQAARLGMTEGHYNAATARRSAPGRRPYPSQDDYSYTEESAPASTPMAVSGPMSRTARSHAGRAEKGVQRSGEGLMNVVTGRAKPQAPPAPKQPQGPDMGGLEREYAQAAAERNRRLADPRYKGKESRIEQAYQQALIMIGQKYGVQR
jgi:hypothetical protein